MLRLQRVVLVCLAISSSYGFCDQASLQDLQKHIGEARQVQGVALSFDGFLSAISRTNSALTSQELREAWLAFGATQQPLLSKEEMADLIATRDRKSVV